MLDACYYSYKDMVAHERIKDNDKKEIFFILI